MTHKFVMELEDNCKGYKEEIEQLERVYGIESIDEHDKQVRSDAIDEYKKKIEFESKWLLFCKVFDPNVCIAFSNLISYAEKLKEKNNDT